jgi:lipoprotein signal peptidase
MPRCPADHCKQMNSTIRAAVVLSIILGCVGCDQLTKAVARDHLHPQETISLLNDTVRLQHAENPGAFLSLGDELPSHVRRIVFTFGGVLLVAGAAFWALRSQRLTSLQIAGAALALIFWMPAIDRKPTAWASTTTTVVDKDGPIAINYYSSSCRESLPCVSS